MNILSLFVLIPLLMMLGLWMARSVNQVRGVMVAGSSALLVLAVWLAVDYLRLRALIANLPFPQPEMLYTDSVVWYAPLHICYSVGVDGISVVMLLLSAIIVFTGTFASWKLKPLTKEYFLWFTLLSTGVFGFFISTDLFTMFMFYEVALIPMYLLIGVWGSGRKEYAAMKLTLMLMGGSAFLLIGILGIYYGAGAQTMNVLEIAGLHNIPEGMQRLFFPAVFLGFGVLGALFPFHTWSPDGHASAPTAVSMLHAGVLMKLGGYGCFRVAMYLMPEGLAQWGDFFLILTTVSVVYGAFSAVVQTDLKYINAYSSVSHCGLVLFALLMATRTSCTGAILQMLSHGLMTALFFALIGMIYGRTHTRDVRELNGLMKVMPFLAVGYGQPRAAGPERLRGRDDGVRGFFRTSRCVPPRLHRHRHGEHRRHGSVYPACGGQDSLWHVPQPRASEVDGCHVGRAFCRHLPDCVCGRTGTCPVVGERHRQFQCRAYCFTF